MSATVPSNPSSSPSAPCWHLRVLSWNTGGIDEPCPDLRASAVANIILNELVGGPPDVLCLQEITPRTETVFLRKLGALYVLPASYDGDEERGSYYTLTLILKRLLSFYKGEAFSQRSPYEGSMMGRGVLHTTIFLGDTTLVVLNTHLESCVESAEERKRQLRIFLNKLGECNENESVVGIGCGDLNVREKEIKEARKDVCRFWDAWEVCCGKSGDRENKYTWEHSFGVNSPTIRMRLDRAYVTRNALPKRFELVGKKEIFMKESPDSPWYPSDHWGMLFQVQIERKITNKRKFIDTEEARIITVD